MASPKPKPTVIAKIGPDTSKGKKKPNAQEPKPAIASLTPPTWLGEQATEVWGKLAPEAIKIGLLTAVDVVSFGRYCVNVADYLTTLAFIQSHGTDLVTTDPETGKITGVLPYPHTNRKLKLEEMMHKYEDRFGLNPSARTRLQVAPPAQNTDPMDEFTDGPPMRIAK